MKRAPHHLCLSMEISPLTVSEREVKLWLQRTYNHKVRSFSDNLLTYNWISEASKLQDKVFIYTFTRGKWFSSFLIWYSCTEWKRSDTSGCCSFPPWCEPPSHWPERGILIGWTGCPLGLHATRRGVPGRTQRCNMHR